jgi:hypothetical protein
MDPSRYEPWWATLTEAERTEVLAVAEVMPDWMAHSLQLFGIHIVGVELPNGTRAFDMTARFRQWRDDKLMERERRAARYAQGSSD